MTTLTPVQKETLARLKQRLDAEGVDYILISHPETLASAEDGAESGLGTLAEMAPTFMLKTEQGWLFATISGASKLAYKKIKKQLGLKDVSLARPDAVLEVTGAIIGTVCMINPGHNSILDERVFNHEFIYGGCGVPQHTLKIRPADLARITDARVFDFTDLKIPE
jgi:prolyl-tRNA editing enzyme YbaK/EbsC (Cys-tRNA(Pro) deacylase)